MIPFVSSICLCANSPGPLDSKIHNKRVKQHCGWVQVIEFDSIRFLAPKNVGFDTKIKVIGQLEAKILRKTGFMAAILKNPRWPLSEVKSSLPPHLKLKPML